MWLRICLVSMVAVGLPLGCSRTPSATSPDKSATPGAEPDVASDDITDFINFIKDTSYLKRDRHEGAFNMLFKRASKVTGAVNGIIEKHQETGAVSALIRLVEETKSSDTKGNDEFWVCYDAVWALACFGAKARAAVPLLQELTRHKDKHIADHASGALKLIEKAQP